MRPEPVTIKLGEMTFIIRPLTLRQIRGIDKILRNIDLTEIEKTFMIIQMGLSRDFPDTARDMEDLEIPMMDLGPACHSILMVGGMTVVEEGNDQKRQTSGT